MSFYDDASLVVIPSAQKTSKLYSVKPTDGSGDLAFTRTGDTATRVNSAGLIEKVRTNLVLQSQTFDNASWNKLISATVTANTSVAPDGTTTADTLSLIANASSSIAQDLSFASAVTLTFSVYAKVASGTKNFRLRADNGITTQAFTATTTWQRFSLTASVLGNTSVYVINDVAATAGDLIIWGAQAEVSDFGATAYIPTTTAAVSVGPVANVPRLDYTGSTCPRLLLEPQRTNVLTYSEQFNNAAWIKDLGASVTANTTTAPDGTISADTLTVSSGQYMYQNISAVSGTAYTISIYVKVASGTNQFKFNTFGSSNNFTSSAYIATTTWQRFSYNFTAVGSGTTGIYPILVDGLTGGSFYIWGAQVEAGAYATSYIPTLGAAVTRGADDCVKSSATSIIGQTEGVVYFEWEYQNTGSSGGNIPISLDGGSGNEMYFWVQTNGVYLTEAFNGSVNQFSFTGAMGSFGTKKIAIAYKNNDFALYINGVLAGTDTSGTVPTLNRLYLGRFYANTTYNIASGIKQALLFKTRLTNAQLAELTTL